MANEIKITNSLRFRQSSNGVVKESIGKGSFSVDVTGEHFIAGIEGVGTSEISITQPSGLGSPGWVWIKFLEGPSAYIDIGTTTGQYTIRLYPGESVAFRCVGANVYIIGLSGGGNLFQYLMIEV